MRLPPFWLRPSAGKVVAVAGRRLASRLRLRLDSDARRNRGASRVRRAALSSDSEKCRAAPQAKHGVCVWSPDGAAPESSSVEIHVTGEACNVAAAKLDVADALVASCSVDAPPAAVQVKEQPPPPPPAAVPYQPVAFGDWGHAATPWAPWTNHAVPLQCSPAALPQSTALVPQQYVDFGSYCMTAQDMMFSGFHQSGGQVGAQRAASNRERAHLPKQTCSSCTSRSRFRTAWWGWSLA